MLDKPAWAATCAGRRTSFPGGQQQRVALARCIVMEPRVLLFDEPLSNLDAKLREQMRVEIRELQQRVGITSVYVTHDQVEAMSISDEIVIMNAGAVEQRGTPQVIYARPASRFVADFIGKANFVDATILDAATVDVAGNRVTIIDMPETPVGAASDACHPPRGGAPLAQKSGTLKGTVRRAMFLGNIAEYFITVDGVGDWLVDSPNPAEAGLFDVGAPIYLSLSPSSVHVLPSSSTAQTRRRGFCY